MRSQLIVRTMYMLLPSASKPGVGLDWISLTTLTTGSPRGEQIFAFGCVVAHPCLLFFFLTSENDVYT